MPAAVIDGRPLFESAAICAAIAVLVPEQDLIARPGTGSRALHDQWAWFTLIELEAWVWTAELDTLDFVLPKAAHVPAIIAQNEMLHRRSAAVLDRHLADTPYLVEGRFTVADIIVAYALHFGDAFGWNRGLPSLRAYMERLFARPHCTRVRHG